MTVTFIVDEHFIKAIVKYRVLPTCDVAALSWILKPEDSQVMVNVLLQQLDLNINILFKLNGLKCAKAHQHPFVDRSTSSA